MFGLGSMIPHRCDFIFASLLSITWLLSSRFTLLYLPSQNAQTHRPRFGVAFGTKGNPWYHLKSWVLCRDLVCRLLNLPIFKCYAVLIWSFGNQFPEPHGVFTYYFMRIPNRNDIKICSLSDRDFCDPHRKLQMVHQSCWARNILFWVDPEFLWLLADIAQRVRTSERVLH